LSVSWAGPGFGQPVIDARYLSPWIARPEQAPFAGTNGILREYWTNYFAGALIGISGPKPPESALTVDKARVVITGHAPLPEPTPISLVEEYPVDQNFRRVQVEGMISFNGNAGDSAILQLSDGVGQAQVRLSGWRGTWPTNAQDWLVK